MFVVLGWTWAQWTSWWSWRGWRAGNMRILHFSFPINLIWLCQSERSARTKHVHTYIWFTVAHHADRCTSSARNHTRVQLLPLPNTLFCQRLNFTTISFQSSFCLIFFFISAHFYLLLISFSILITNSSWNLIPSSSAFSLCLSIIFHSPIKHTHTHTHPHFLPHYHSLSALHSDWLSLSQGDDGEIGPRGLPGEPVSDRMYYHLLRL